MDDIARDRYGRPIYDRYGRPVRRRSASTHDAGNPTPRPQGSGRHRAPEPTRVERSDAPRQHFPSPEERRAARAQQPQQPQRPRQPYQAPQQPFSPPHPPASSYSRRPQAAHPAPPRRRPRLRVPRPRGCGCSLSGLLSILVVAVLVLGLWADASLNRVDALPDSHVSATAGTNWLLVGSDSRQGMTEEDIARLGTGGDIGTGRTDTIILLHIPRIGGGKPTLVSIPRDSYVSIPGYGWDKINASFSYGGPKLLAQTVEQNTGLRIDHYAEIGMGGLAGVVDAVNGVDVCVQEAITDPLAQLDVQAGCQTLDGPTALGYVRTRATAQGDLDRVARQRQFLGALLKAATSPWTLLNPFRLIPLISTATSSFTVDDGDHIWHLARVAWAMRSGPETQTVPVGGFADYDVGSVVLWDEAGAGALWDSLR